MGFGLVIAGFVLLFNPVINVFDVLPDAIGFALIVAGLTKLSYFVDDVARARSMFFKLALVQAVKIASVFLIVGDVNPGSTKVLLSFVFGIAEVIMFAPAVVWLFEGLSFSGVLYNGKNVSRVKINRRGKQIDVPVSTRNYIIFFYVFRCVATLVPELTELQMYDHVGSVEALSRPLSYYKPALYRLFGLLVVVFGVIFIVRTVKYFGSIIEDKTYCETFGSMFKNALETRQSFFMSHRMSTALMMFIAASFTAYTLVIDEVNLLIGAISAAFFAASAIMMCKYLPKARVLIPLSAARAGTAIVSFIMQVRYFDEYSVEAIDFVDKAAAQYYRMAAVTAADMVLAAALLIMYCVVILGAVREHLKVCGVMDETAQYSKARRDEETFSYLRIRIITTAVLGTLYFISAGIYRFVELYLPAYIVVFVVLSIAFIAYSVYVVTAINNNLYGKEIASA